MQNAQPLYDWQCRDRTLTLGGRTLVMGILNVTPDSFSDGGHYFDANAAVARALEMVDQGADIIDIGGESSRPGATPVSIAEELSRTLPIIEKIRAQSDVPISIDTIKSEVAFHALEVGAHIINDISAFEGDEKMAGIAAEANAGVVLMHRKGSPRTMQKNPVYENVVKEVQAYLGERVDFAMAHGVAREHLVVDPGIGFGKTTEHNLALLHDLPSFAAGGFPLLVGASRKRFIGELTGRAEPEERKAGSLSVAAWAIMHGVHILRVHDVIDTCDTCRLLNRLAGGDL